MKGRGASGPEPISSSVPGGSTWGSFYLGPPRLVWGTERGQAGPCQRFAPNDISCLLYPESRSFQVRRL